MERFGHFFEFIAALNSAYIVSDYFVDSLLKKINSHFKQLNKRLNGLLVDQANNVMKLGEEESERLHSEGNRLSPTLDRLRQRGNGIQDRCFNVKSNLKSSFKNKSLFVTFNYWCTFASLYCILILLLNGFGFAMDGNVHNAAALLFNFSSTGLILFFIAEKKKQFWRNFCLPSYNKIIVSFLISFLLALSFILIFTGEPSWLKGAERLRTFNIICAILLPSAHFPIYFMKLSRFSRNKSKTFMVELNSIELESQAFAKDIESSFQTVNELSAHQTRFDRSKGW